MSSIQAQPKHPRKDNKGNKFPASPPPLYPTPQYHLSSTHRPPHSLHGGSSGENVSAGPSVDARQGPEHLQAPQGARAGGSSTTVAKVPGPPEPACFRGGDEESSDSGMSGTVWVRSRLTRRFLLFLLLPDVDPGVTMVDELPTSPTASSVPPQKAASSLSATGSATNGSGTSSASPLKARGLSGSSPPPNTVTIETAGDDGGSLGVGALLGARRADSSFSFL